MILNESMQLALEQALAALIPYLQTLADPELAFDFLDAPFPPALEKFFLAGHAAESVPDDKTDFLAFIAEPADWKTLRGNAVVNLHCELNTGGIADEKTRSEAVARHSQRVSALLQLFSRRYIATLKAAMNKPLGGGPDNRPWAGLGFTGWDLIGGADGNTPSGNSAIAKPQYTFEVFREAA